MRSEEHRKVEAVLFAVGRDIAVEEVARLCRLQEGQAVTVLNELKEEYAQGQNALMLIEKGKFWKFSVKDRYLPLVTSLVQHTELDKSVMETLAVIAWKYPIIQSDLIKIRHNKAYDHLKMLMEREFISKEKSGRTYKIKLTPKFFDYFDLPSQDAKEAFKKVIPPEIQQEIAQAEAVIEVKQKVVEEKVHEKAAVSEKPQETSKSPDFGSQNSKSFEKTEEQLAKEAADALDEKEQ